MKQMRMLGAFALWAFVAIKAAAVQSMPVQVGPSGPEVPANLLRISLVFAQVPEEAVLPRLELRHADGSVIDKPFLEQELWSPSGKILTVLLHPGRVKSGLIAHDTAGPVLEPDEGVVLMLEGHEIKRWRVGADDLDGPLPGNWKLHQVKAGTTEPLVVDLDAPIDARDVDYLAVADGRGRRLPGHAELTEGERRWSFVPATPWRAGTYDLAVFSQLEDASGNRMGGHFEERAGIQDPSSDATLKFTVH